MPQPTCYDCVYSYWDKCQRIARPWSVFPSWPICSNHPDHPGELRPVPRGGVCRNYRPRLAPPAAPQGDVKQIGLVDGSCVYVDAADYEWLSQYRWYAHSDGYVVRSEKGRVIFMHREIVRPPKGKIVDHIDGNRRNNCRSNLRPCTYAENAHNRRKSRGSRSRFKGVGSKPERGCWYAGFKYKGERIWLGSFKNEVEAARAYDRGVVGAGVECARLNFPEEWPPERRAEVRAAWLKTHRRRKPKHPRLQGKKAPSRPKPPAHKNPKPRPRRAERTRTKAPKAPKRKAKKPPRQQRKM